MLCFVEADWPLMGGDFTIAGVSVLWPKKAASHIWAARRYRCDSSGSGPSRPRIIVPAGVRSSISVPGLSRSHNLIAWSTALVGISSPRLRVISPQDFRGSALLSASGALSDWRAAAKRSVDSV